MCQEFKKTRFITVPITETLQGGIPIGQGKCGAVRLRLNTYLRNQPTPTWGDALERPFFVYYGDAQSQENELFAFSGLVDANTSFPVMSFNGNWTPKIYCENLEEVFIRYGGQTQESSWPETAYVQVMIMSNE